MSVLIGNEGSIVLAAEWGSATKINTWSASFSRVSTDITGFGDATHRRRLGVLDITGSAAGHLARDTGTSLPGEDLLITGGSMDGRALELVAQLDPDAGGALTKCSYSFTAICDQMQIGADKNGDQTVSFNFQLSGGTVPTVVWEE